MKKKILFFVIVFTLLMSGGNAVGEPWYPSEDPYLFRGYIDQGYLPLTRLALRDPLANLLYDLQPAISRTRYRSFFALYGTDSYSGISGHHNRFGFFDHQLQIYYDRGLGSLAGLVPRNSAGDLFFDSRPGISRIRYRSFFTSYASHSYRRFPGHPYRRNLYGHQYRLSYQDYYYRHGYTQAYYNHELQRQYYGHRLYRNQPATRPFFYRSHSGVRPYGSGLSFRGRFR